MQGLPQSGTGQTSLLTGVNAAAHIGEHRGPYPGAELRRLLARRAIWRRLDEAGLNATLANAYPDRFLKRARAGAGRMGAFARSAQLCGVDLRGPRELREGRAVSAFLHNRGWREHLGHGDMPRLDEVQAGANLAALAAEHDLTVFEYYATDIAGHHPERIDPVVALESLDRFLAGVLQVWRDLPGGGILLASDHGNIEDETSGRHSRNPALGALWTAPGDAAPTSLVDAAPASLVDVAPLIERFLGGAEGGSARSAPR